MKTRAPRKGLLYASNVSNVAHLEYLLSNLKWNIFIMRPWIPNKSLITFTKLISKKLSQTLSSRENDRVTTLSFVPLWLGVGQFYAPLKNLIAHSPMSLRETTLINNILEAQVKKKIPQMHIIITTRDIFPKTCVSSGKIHLAEMRELHPNNIWNRDIPIFGFPHDREKRLTSIKVYNNKFENIKAGASGLITYSNIAKASFEANGFPADRIFVFPLKYPAITLPSVKSSKTSTCLFVGRDDPNKGLDLAVLATQTQKVPLLVVGHYSTEVIQWMRKFKHVEFVGPVSRNQVKKLMLTSKALLAPSVESYGLAVIEALESGCLIVSSKMNGAAETFVESTNVFCADNLNLKDFTLQLGRALQSNYNFDDKIEIKSFSEQFEFFIESLESRC